MLTGDSDVIRKYPTLKNSKVTLLMKILSRTQGIRERIKPLVPMIKYQHTKYHLQAAFWRHYILHTPGNLLLRSLLFSCPWRLWDVQMKLPCINHKLSVFHAYTSSARCQKPSPLPILWFLIMPFSYHRNINQKNWCQFSRCAGRLLGFFCKEVWENWVDWKI